MAGLAVNVDQGGPENPLQGEETYFDGSHLQCMDYETLALFVYYPTMWHILKLATVEFKREST